MLAIHMLRACPEACQFLDDVWSRTEFVQHRYWENAAVMDLLGYDMKLYDLELEPRRRLRPTSLLQGTQLINLAWNSIPDDPSAQPRFKHYAGQPMYARLVGMRADYAELLRKVGAESLGVADAPSIEQLPSTTLASHQQEGESALGCRDGR
jgi:hypothetical protein